VLYPLSLSGLKSRANTQESMRHGSFAGKLTNAPQMCVQDGRTRAVEEISGGHQEQLLAMSAGGSGRGAAEMDVLFTNREDMALGRGDPWWLCLWGP